MPAKAVAVNIMFLGSPFIRPILVNVMSQKHSLVLKDELKRSHFWPLVNDSYDYYETCFTQMSIG